MICSQILSGIATDCSQAVGGVRRVLIANAADVAARTLTDGVVSAVTMRAGTAFHEYRFRAESADMTSAHQVSDENGTDYVQTLLDMTFSRMESAKRREVVALVQTEAAAIVEDANGLYWFLGWDSPLTISAGDGMTGTSRADGNAYSITMQDDSREMPHEVDPSIIDALLIPATGVTRTVSDLVAEGYAVVVPGNGGDCIGILPSCPYAFADITDLADVATDSVRLTAGRRNTVTWNSALPAGWTQAQVSRIYAAALPFPPRADLLWAVRNAVPRLEITFAGGEWAVNDYPWGSGVADGVFAPRYDAAREAEYAALGFRQTPAEVVVTITGIYNSVAQCMFNRMQTTQAFTLNCGGVFSVHDAVGLFEGCSSMRELTITGPFRWDAWRTVHNAFLECAELLSIPYVEAWGRDSVYNTIYPRFDGTRGSADCHGLFDFCTKLRSIGPRLDMNAVSLAGCTADGQQQAALSGDVFDCPALEDVRLVNVGNGSWSFADRSTHTYIPKMDAASIAYLLEHVKDAAGQGWSLTFSALHAGEVSSAAIADAEAKGWTVIFANS